MPWFRSSSPPSGESINRRRFVGKVSAVLLPSPLVGEGGSRRLPDEGSLSAKRDPSSVADFVRATFSHKGRRQENRASPRLAKSQVDALAAQQRVHAVGERGDAVKEQPRRPAPHHDVAVL